MESDFRHLPSYIGARHSPVPYVLPIFLSTPQIEREIIAYRFINLVSVHKSSKDFFVTNTGISINKKYKTIAIR